MGEDSAAARTTEWNESGPALALRFYLVVSLTAVLLGLGGVLVASAAERTVVPFFADSGYAPGTSALLPHADLVGLTALAAAALLLVTSAITVARLRRAVERSPQ